MRTGHQRLVRGRRDHRRRLQRRTRPPAQRAQPPAGRRSPRSIADAAAQLRRHITATRRALDALDLPDTLHGRLRGVAVDAWTPHVLLVNNPDPHDLAQLHQLHQDLAAAGRSGGALGLATPMSIMVATGKGAEVGVLFKNAEAIATSAQG